MTAYYNEFDPFAAAWIRELIKAGLIAPGIVDERSIEDVTPNDLAGFTQCHFFAGIGVWSYALRRAGWSDDRPVWTGSCPCQPFSAAGKGDGFADERHLWPSFHHLIKMRKPPVIFGEQVASKAVDDWIDLVHADLEAVGYAFGSVPFPSAGVGAPHIRDRNFWVANSEHEQHEGGVRVAGIIQQEIGGRSATELAGCGATSRVGDNNNTRLEGLGCGHQAEGGRVGAVGSVAEAGEFSGMGDARGTTSERNTGSISGTKTQEHGERIAVDGDMPFGLEHASASVGRLADTSNRTRQRSEPRATERRLPQSVEEDAAVRPGPTNGFWRAADWLGCRDGKWRPVEPSTFPLVDGTPARVGRLRGYGNAINAEAATAFIEAYLEI